MKNLTTQQGKMGVLHELVNNVKTVRTVAGGKFLEDRWNSSVDTQSKLQRLQEEYRILQLPFHNWITN